ncbi:alpha/beta hydrolase family protein [Nocardioides donggukensis]|uniref:Prolyl oligopeptidase family serine peptidase n=1 Tax=Nocardioides donggukensis TaxID=2774019 RepID=A0A927Q0F9_9ACTN|nr:alpha/beta fold hydrolase [Nocardioides donggukensis]MBD8870600.1 prolyl oligopeptidase family serine peptidase [Nocardioides donggukensis]
MNAVRRAGRWAVLYATLVGIVMIGLAAHAGSYLFGFTQPSATASQDADPMLSHAAPGRHPVGIRRIGPDDAPVAMTVWYPASDSTDSEPATRYSYSLTVLGTQTATALATYPGVARHGVEADLAGGPYPLVVLSAGFAISPASYAWLAEHLASHGLVVVAPQHAETLDPSTLWRSAIDRPEVVAQTRAHVETAATPGGDLAGLVDPKTVAVVGHSYGGYTALAAAGAQLDPDAFTSGCATARADDDPIVFLCDALQPHLDDIVVARTTEPEPVDAVVSLAGDAAMFGETGLAAVTAPLLVIGGTADHDSPFDWTTRLAYESAASRHKVEVSLRGAGHFVFTGGCDRTRRILRLVTTGFCDDPAWERAKARAVTQHYVAAFLLAELTGATAARTALTDPAEPSGVRLRSAEPSR